MSGRVGEAMTRRICVIDDCDDYRAAHGLCGMHNARKRRHGDPLYTERPTWGMPVEQRFWSKVDASGVCWEWTDKLRPDGYAKFTITLAPRRRRLVFVHRWAYEHLVGPIPQGMELDHLCRNRRCVDPDHLEPTTKYVNAMRGGSPTAIHARKTHCVRGHPFSGPNLQIYIRPDNGRKMRVCRACKSLTSLRALEEAA